MSPDELTYDLEENARGGRIVARDDDGHEAEITFRKTPDGLSADHTGVPRALGNKGVGTELVRRLVQYARQEQQAIIPRCSFVEAQFRRHPEWRDTANG